MTIKTNKKLKEKSRCADCIAIKSFFDKKRTKVSWKLLCLNF